MSTYLIKNEILLVISYSHWGVDEYEFGNKCSESVTFWNGFAFGSRSLNPYTELRIRIWIRILLEKSVSFKKLTKKIEFSCLFLTASKFTLVLKDTPLRSRKTVYGRIQTQIRIHTNSYGSWTPKNIRTRNTARKLKRSLIRPPKKITDLGGRLT